MDPGEFGGPAVRRDARSGRQARGPAGGHAAVGHRDGHPRPRAAALRDPIRSAPVSTRRKPGSSTRAAPRAGPRAPSSPTATFCSAPTPTPPTSTTSTNATPAFMPPRCHTARADGRGVPRQGRPQRYHPRLLRARTHSRRPDELPERRDVRRADHGDPARHSSARGLRRYPQPQDDQLRRRADVCRRLEAGTRTFRPQALPAVRPGRVPDDHLRAAEVDARRNRAPALRGAARLDGRGAHRLRDRDRRRSGRELPRGEIGEIVTRSDAS